MCRMTSQPHSHTAPVLHLTQEHDLVLLVELQHVSVRTPNTYDSVLGIICVMPTGYITSLLL